MQYKCDPSWPSKCNKNLSTRCCCPVFLCTLFFFFTQFFSQQSWLGLSQFPCGACASALNSGPEERGLKVKLFTSSCKRSPKWSPLSKGKKPINLWSNLGNLKQLYSLGSSWQWETWPSLLVLINEYKSAKSVRKSTSCALCQVFPVLLRIKSNELTAQLDYNHCHCEEEKTQTQTTREESQWWPTFGIEVPLPLGPLIMLQTRGMTYLGSFKAESQLSHEIQAAWKHALGCWKLACEILRMSVSFDNGVLLKVTKKLADIHGSFSGRIQVQLCHLTSKTGTSWFIQTCHRTTP